jgi:6-phosphogluconolactonase
MNNPAAFLWRIVVASAVSLAGSLPALAATFVYVSNAEDATISVYSMGAGGELTAAPPVHAGYLVMPLAVSPDKRFLYASVRSKPYSVHTFAIDAASGALAQVTVAPLADSMPYISVDRTGRYLFGASYGGNLVSVNAIGEQGAVAPVPLQVLHIGRNAHSVRIDASNRFLFVPTLGSDEVFQFLFDARSGRLTSNTPAVVLLKAGSGPRHFVFSRDNRFVYVLNELTGAVSSFALDNASGLLSELSSVSGLPPDSGLVPGAPRGPVGAPGGPPPRNADNDAWAADIHATPDGRFLYVSERTHSTLSVLSVDQASGKLTYLGSTPTEKQPRGFAIDPRGQYLVASGELSDRISVYAIDQASGALRLLNRYPAGRGANWVEIVSFD